VLLAVLVAAASPRLGASPRRRARPPTCSEKCVQSADKAMRSCGDLACIQEQRDALSECGVRCALARNETDLETEAPPAEKQLPVTHHAQSQVIWCWAASSAMVLEYVLKRTVSDCDVASALDQVTGGEGHCCAADGRLRSERCYHARNTELVAGVLRSYGLSVTVIHGPLGWDELKRSIDAGYPVIAGLYWGGETGHIVVITGYREPGTVIVDDPAQSDTPHSEYLYRWLVGDPNLPWHHNRTWVGSWLLAPDVSAPPPSNPR
jgi:hypothetical protein